MSRLLALSLTALLCGCTDDTFAVVSVLTYSGSLNDVSQLRVRVTSDATQDTLLYPKRASGLLHLDTTSPLTLSVEMAPSPYRPATFEVEALAPDGSVLGYGMASAVVGGNAVDTVMVEVVIGATAPVAAPVGAIVDGGSQMVCAPLDPTATCGADRTCGLLCADEEPTVAMCYVAGSASSGDACSGNADCSSGSGCFTFSADDCSVAACLRFCAKDDDCGQAGAYCNVTIPCGAAGSFQVCSQPCDPTLTTSSCAAGLACFVYGGQTTDCACPGLGGPGSTCTQNSGCSGDNGCSGCSAGLSCVIPESDGGASQGACHPVCMVANPTCPAGSTCHGFSNASSTYGYCL